MLEADFQRFYGLDIVAEINNGMTWRRFGVLLAGLPPESMWRRVVAASVPVVTGDQARALIARA